MKPLKPFQVLIDARAQRSLATQIMDRVGIPRKARTYYSRKAARSESGNDDARYVAWVWWAA